MTQEAGVGDQDSLLAQRASALPIDAGATPEPDPLKGGDVYGWAVEQAALIRAGRYDEIDWINVADEIESVGKSEIRALRSNLQIVLTHMLKWDHQCERRSQSWFSSIDVHRIHVEVELNDNPSLKPKLVDIIASAYKAARAEASGQTNLPLKTFPAACSYDWNAIMTRPCVLDGIDETV